MTDSLYKIYKKFYQRHYRSPENFVLRYMSDCAHDIVKSLYQTKGNSAPFKRVLVSARSAASDLLTLEVELGVRILFSRELIAALKVDNPALGVPYPVDHRWNHEDSDGLVYVVTSNSRPGECKLGATTMTMQKRIYHYERRYRCRLTEYFSTLTRSPFVIEMNVASRLREFRVAGNTINESNEWYACAPKLMKAHILEAIG